MTETHPIILGIDAGGTFTDFVCVELGKPIRISVHKTLSTPSAPEQAIIQGIKAMGLEDHVDHSLLQVVHGSTVATNAVLEGKLARTALIANRGFADLLTLGRQTRPELYALEFDQRPPPVPKHLCLETGGRLGADGAVVDDLSEGDLALLVERLQKLDPEAVAINLLFSFLDPQFEQRIEQQLKSALPTAFISRSSRVLPEYREYERGMATWFNASLGPVVSGYLGRLSQQLGNCSLQVMQSSGETRSAASAAEAAVSLLLSGPAGGLTALEFLGRQIGNSKLISFDMGGTSTDVALLDGAIALTNEAYIDRYPVAVPMVDMHTIGAGGGSIAYVDAGGLLRVGPRSAGAEPGPACYGKGGSDATVTDANLVLGRLDPDTALAGDLSLDIALARTAIAKIAMQIGLSEEETAKGIVNLANENMVQAIRLISVNRGHDPAEFTLTSFGGAGGLHVCALAEAMNMRRAMVPIHGGVLSALGMATARRGRQFSRSLAVGSVGQDHAALDAAFLALTAGARQELLNEGLVADDLQFQRSMDMRYQGQSYTLNVPFESLPQAESDFHRLHEKRYGYRLSHDVERVNLRLHAHDGRRPFSLPRALTPAHGKIPAAARVLNNTSLWHRSDMMPGCQVQGPAIITEYSATTFVATGWEATVDEWGNLLLTLTV